MHDDDLTVQTEAEAVRFGSYLEFGSGECWIWQGARTGRGYGQYRLPNRRGRRQFADYAHRISYRLFKGCIPAGLCTDHLCRVPSCCNPDHLELVTPKENSHRSPIFQARMIAGQERQQRRAAAVQARRDRIASCCKRGHPRSEHGVWARGRWVDCRLCHTERQIRLFARQGKAWAIRYLQERDRVS